MKTEERKQYIDNYFKYKSQLSKAYLNVFLYENPQAQELSKDEVFLKYFCEIFEFDDTHHLVGKKDESLAFILQEVFHHLLIGQAISERKEEFRGYARPSYHKEMTDKLKKFFKKELVACENFASKSPTLLNAEQFARVAAYPFFPTKHRVWQDFFYARHIMHAVQLDNVDKEFLKKMHSLEEDLKAYHLMVDLLIMQSDMSSLKKCNEYFPCIAGSKITAYLEENEKSNKTGAPQNAESPVLKALRLSMPRSASAAFSNNNALNRNQKI